MGRWLSGGWLGDPFSPNLKVNQGGSTGVLTVGGVANLNTTKVTSAASTTSTLMSYIIPANAFNANNQGIRFWAWGTVAADTSQKSITVVVGTTVSQIVSNAASNNLPWFIRGNIVRVAATTQVMLAEGRIGANVGSVLTLPALNDTAGMTLAFGGGGATATVGSVQQLGLIVEFLNA